MPDLERLNVLLRQRCEITAKIKELTNATVFSHDPEDMESETERFTGLFEGREPLVAELIQVHNEIGEKGYTLAKNTGGEFLEMLNESDENLKYVELKDKAIKELGETMMKNASDNIKRIKKGRELSLKYGEHSETDGHLFDNKN